MVLSCRVMVCSHRLSVLTTVCIRHHFPAICDASFDWGMGPSLGKGVVVGFKTGP